MNSMSEFNRSYIPRVVVEVDEEGAKEERWKQEDEEIRMFQLELDKEDMMWEERKRREQEITVDSQEEEE